VGDIIRGSAFLFGVRWVTAYIMKTMVPQTSPFIMPFTIDAPEIPKIDVGAGIPMKLLIISPGGKIGITRVIAKRHRKAITKTTAFDMFN